MTFIKRKITIISLLFVLLQGHALAECETQMITAKKTNDVQVYMVKDQNGNLTSDYVTTYGGGLPNHPVADLMIVSENYSNPNTTPYLYLLNESGDLRKFSSLGNYVDHDPIAVINNATTIRHFRTSNNQDRLMIAAKDSDDKSVITITDKNGVMLDNNVLTSNDLQLAYFLGTQPLLGFSLSPQTGLSNLYGHEIIFDRTLVNPLPGGLATNFYYKFDYNLNTPASYAISDAQQISDTQSTSFTVPTFETVPITALGGVSFDPNKYAITFYVRENKIYGAFTIRGSMDFLDSTPYIDTSGLDYDDYKNGRLDDVRRIRYYEGYLYVSHRGGISRFDVKTGAFIDLVVDFGGTEEPMQGMVFRKWNCKD